MGLTGQQHRLGGRPHYLEAPADRQKPCGGELQGAARFDGQGIAQEVGHPRVYQIGNARIGPVPLAGYGGHRGHQHGIAPITAGS